MTRRFSFFAISNRNLLIKFTSTEGEKNSDLHCFLLLLSDSLNLNFFASEKGHILIWIKVPGILN